MNKEQIIDEAHQNYVKETMFDSDPKWLEPVPVMDMKTGEKSMGVRQYGKESFINKCKTDPEFSEKWGLKIEERELSLEERQELQTKMFNGLHYLHYSLNGEEGLHKEYDKQNVPRRVITLEYNNEKTYCYE
jgi:hypothetical protein